MRFTIVTVLLVFCVCATVTDATSVWRHASGWLQALKERLAEKMESENEEDSAQTSNVWRYWRNQDAGNGDTGCVGTLKCRIWLTICNYTDNNDGVSSTNKWVPIRKRLLSMKKEIWNSGSSRSFWLRKRLWSTMWKKIFRTTRQAATVNLEETCSKWREQCAGVDGNGAGEGESGTGGGEGEGTDGGHGGNSSNSGNDSGGNPVTDEPTFSKMVSSKD